MSRKSQAKKRGKGRTASIKIESIPEVPSNDNSCPFDNLLDELVINIFKKFKLSQIESLSRVCQRWCQLTSRQELWRFHAIKKWGKDIVPNSYAFRSDSVQVDLKNYLIPTYTNGKTKAVDWRKYFKIRYFFEDAKFALDRHFYLMREEAADPIVIDFGDSNPTNCRTILIPEGLDQLMPEEWASFDEVSWSSSSDEEDMDFGDYLDGSEEAEDDDESGNEEVNNNTPQKNYTEDLHTTSISNFFMRLPLCKRNKLDLPERLPRLLTHFAVEVFPLLLEANMHAEVLMATMGIFRSAPHFHNAISQSIFDICLMVEDRPRLMAQLLFAACEQFHPGEVETAQKTLLKNILQKLLSLVTNSEKIAEQSNKFNENLRNFYSDDSPDRVREIIEYFTATPDPHILNKEESKIKQSMTRFVDPLNKYELFGIEAKGIVPEISLYSEPKEELLQVLIDFIVEKYHESKNNSEKILLLAMSDVVNTELLKFCLGLFPLACEATKEKDDKVAIAAYTLIYRKMSAKLMHQLPEKLVRTVFETLLRGLDRFPGNSLCIISMLVKLLKNNGKIVSDQQLEELNTKILANMAKPELFFHPDVLLTSEYFLFDDFYKFGKIFGERMRPYLPKYRKAILETGKVEIRSALKISKKGDKVIMEMNSTPQRWIQYSLLGRICGGDQFNTDELEYVKELMKIRNQQLKKDEWGMKTLHEFHALFGDTLMALIKPKKKLKEHFDSVLGIFPKEIAEYGKKYFTVSDTSTGFLPKVPIPETASQFETAMNVWRMQKSGKQEKITDDGQLFHYIYSQQFRDTLKNDTNKKQQKKPKIYSPEFNTVEWDNYSNYFKSLSMKQVLQQFTYKITMEKLVNGTIIDSITNNAQLLKAFHILLAFAKSNEASSDVIDQVFTTYYLLKEKFDENTQCFYINTLANILGNRLSGKDVDSTLRAYIYDLGHPLVSEFHSLKEPNYSPMMGLVSFSVQLDLTPPDLKRFRPMTNDVLRLLMAKSPLGLYQALLRCNDAALLFVDHPEDDPLDARYALRLHALAYLGFHFGMFFIYCLRSGSGALSHHGRKIKRISFDGTILSENFILEVLSLVYTALGGKMIDYLKRVNRSTVKPQQIDRMERFLVLYQVYKIAGLREDVRYVNLYNAAYLEAAVVPKIIRKKTFTTGIADLDKRVKKWEGIYDLTKKVFYGEDYDEENSEEDFYMLLN